VTLSYAAEKYMLARDHMATAHGTLQERLRGAFIHHIDAVRGQRDLPEGLRDDHEALVVRATCIVDRNGMGPYSATLAEMSDAEASDVAREVLFLEYRIRSLYQAPQWHYMGAPTALIRVMPERRDRDTVGQGPGAN
jgi:hypothetical protein